MIEEHAKIAFNRKVARDTFLLGFESPEMVAGARPGQFVMIRVREGTDPLLRRPFSICSVQDDRLVLILYRVVGQGTALLSDAREGEKLSVLGPLGNGFRFSNSRQRALLVAGGMGIAPLIFLAREMEKRRIVLLAGTASAADRVDISEFGLLHIRVFNATDDGTTGHKGPVTDLLQQELNTADRKATGIFTCGPAPMLKKVSAMSDQWKVPCQVSLEAHMACGLGACQGCAVKASAGERRTYYHVCRDGPAFHAESIDWDDLS